MRAGGFKFAGMGSEFLVLSHFCSLELPCAQVVGSEADTLVLINGIWRTIQVKGRIERLTFYAHKMSGDRQNFSDYQVDAFAFCHIKNPFPYYMHKFSVTDSLSFAPNAFTKAGRDQSWAELVRRWDGDAVPTIPVEEVGNEGEQTSMFQ